MHYSDIEQTHAPIIPYGGVVMKGVFFMARKKKDTLEGLKAVIYARYSSNSQTEQSIEGQLRACYDYAEKHNMTVVGTYIDRAISGKTDKRDEFQKMIKDSDKKPFDVIICYKMDRFSRNKYDSAIYKARLKKNGVLLRYAAESIPEGPEGIILESLLEGMAEYYSEELSQKINRGLQESALKCKHTGGPPPLGYLVTEEKKLAINDTTAPLVQKIFAMYDAGNTVVDICKELTAMNTKTGIGNAWNKNSLRNILKNEKYIGVYEARGVRVEGGVPAIVELDIFLRVQERIKANRRAPAAGQSVKADFLLTGKLYCGKCQQGMLGVSGTSKQGKAHYYYACGNKRRHKSCDKKDVRKDWLENFVVTETVRHMLQPDKVNIIAKRCVEIHTREMSQDRELAYLKGQLAETTKALDNVMAAIEQGIINKTTKSRMVELEEAKDKLEFEIGLCSVRQPKLEEKHVKYMLSQFIRETDAEIEEYNRDIIETFISAIYLFDDKLIVTYNLTNENSELDSSELSFLQSLECDSNGVFTGSPLEQLSGAEGSRTPVRKLIDKDFYHHSRFICAGLYPRWFPWLAASLHAKNLGSF